MTNPMNKEIFRLPKKKEIESPAIVKDKNKIVFLSAVTRTPFGTVGGSLDFLRPI